MYGRNAPLSLIIYYVYGMHHFNNSSRTELKYSLGKIYAGRKKPLPGKKNLSFRNEIPTKYSFKFSIFGGWWKRYNLVSRSDPDPDLSQWPDPDQRRDDGIRSTV
jgi:hypothetical protein